MIIDFHTHIFPDAVAERIIHQLSTACHIRAFSDGSREGLKNSMQAAGIGLSVNLPVHTRADQVEKINSSLILQQEMLLSEGIMTFGGMHPDYSGYRGELRRLQENGIRGIKLHPAFQGVELDDARMLRVIGAASELGLIVLVHGGLDIGFPEHNYSSVPMVLKVLREVRPEKLVLAHMGGWAFWEDVRRDLAGAGVYLDTAFSLLPPEAPVGDAKVHEKNHLSPEEFAGLVRAHGVERILFGTDSPWADQKRYVDLLYGMPLTEGEKEKIFHENAEKLLQLD